MWEKGRSVQEMRSNGSILIHTAIKKVRNDHNVNANIGETGMTEIVRYMIWVGRQLKDIKLGSSIIFKTKKRKTLYKYGV